MVQASYFEYALDCVRQLHNLASDFQKTHEDRVASLAPIFHDDNWQGEARDVFKSEHDNNITDFPRAHDPLLAYRDRWLDSLLEAVDSYNSTVRQQTVQELQIRLNAWNDEVWGTAWNESNTLEQGGMAVIKTVDTISDLVAKPFGGESRLIVDNAEYLVPEHHRVAGNKHMRPTAPYETFPNVFVEYSGSTDPTQPMTAHYRSIPNPLH